jgi:hypothetical protein
MDKSFRRANDDRVSQEVRVARLPPEAEVFLPLPSGRNGVLPATSFRTTWLASSLTALRERQMMDAYLAQLPREHHDIILGNVVGQWAPIEVARQHYAACDKLALSPGDLEQIGMSVTRRVHGSALSTVLTLAKQSGVTPWTACAQLNRLWSRIWLGGGVCVYKLGPKDAVIEITSWPLAKIAYLRNTMPSVVRAMIELFCRRAYCTLYGSLCTGHSLGVHASWV